MGSGIWRRMMAIALPPVRHRGQAELGRCRPPHVEVQGGPASMVQCPADEPIAGWGIEAVASLGSLAPPL